MILYCELELICSHTEHVLWVQLTGWAISTIASHCNWLQVGEIKTEGGAEMVLYSIYIPCLEKKLISVHAWYYLLLTT